MGIRSVLLRFLLVLLPAALGAEATPYYVDGNSGSDSNTGLSPESPWKSLEKVNETTFQPGDRIFFRAGTRYTGRLSPKGSGTGERPIVVATYGSGGRPRIETQGKFQESILLTNQDHWEVSGLELTNTGEKREEFRYGVRVRAWNYGTMRGIRLKNLFVHDVNGSLVKRDPGEGHGIVWENGGSNVRSNFDGLLIEGCRLLRTDRNGISGYAAYPARRAKEQPNRNVIIRGNLLEDIGGDGIKIWGADGAVVEHNILRGARRRCDDYAAGIWPWASDNTIIQFNEVSGVKGTRDGQAFDSDGYSNNTVIQYNYSHDNDGGFLLICCDQSNGTTVRYNISQNDRQRLFHIAAPARNIDIYNNVFFVGPGIDVHLFLWTGGRGWPEGIRVRNNIFYALGVGRNSSATRRNPANDGTYLAEPGAGMTQNVIFERNLFYGRFAQIPNAWRTLSSDPLLVRPGSGGDGIRTLDGYKLRRGSPAIGAGVAIQSSGQRDFWGGAVPVTGSPAIGAHQP